MKIDWYKDIIRSILEFFISLVDFCIFYELMEWSFFSTKIGKTTRILNLNVLFILYLLYDLYLLVVIYKWYNRIEIYILKLLTL